MTGRSTKLWASTPLRLALAVAAIYLVVGLISFWATFKVVEDNTAATLRQTLEQEMAGLRAVPSRRALMSLVQSQSQIAQPEERILSYLLPGGILVGNAALFANGEGYRAVSIDDETNIRGPYFALGEVVHDGVLTIAVSAAPLITLRHAFQSVFVYSFAPTTIVVLLGSLLIARRMGRRLRAIDRTLESLTNGDYAARVSEARIRDDDIGQISTNINNMAAAQERQITALRQVSSDIAHDLKTPIQRLSVTVEQISSTPQVGPEIRELSDQALAETKHIDQIFRSLLQIAQVEGGALRAQLKPVEFCREVATICELYQATAETEDRLLTFSKPDQPFWIKGERTLIGQMVSNLIENAFRHTEPGTDVAVTIKAEKQGTVTLSIKDKGPGIPRDQHDFVLRRLARLDHSRSTPGNGLGLSLVAAIVEAHDGTLALSDAEPGLHVAINLPTISPPPNA